MSDINRVGEIKRGYYLFTNKFHAESKPSHLYQTPGLATKSLYSQYVRYFDKPVSGLNPFCVEGKFESVTGPEGDSGVSIEIPTGKQKEQVGRGEIDENNVKSEPETEAKVKSETETEAKISMQQLLEKMKRPVIDVKVAKIKKRKSEQPQEPVKSETTTSNKQLKKVFTWF